MSDPYTPDTPLAAVDLPWETPTDAATDTDAPATIADDVKRHAVKLATLRTELAAREASVKAARRGFEDTLAVQLRTIEGLKREMEATEGTVRALTLVNYETTGNKKPCPGVEVKVGTVYEYDKAAAWEWAQKSNLCIIPAQLDDAAFQKIAKATPLPFVTTRDEPKAQIAKDLLAALDGAA